MNDDAPTGRGPERPSRTTMLKVAFRPYLPADRTDSAGRREIAVLAAISVGLGAWALFPSDVESGLYLPLLPDGSSQAAPQRDSTIRRAGSTAVPQSGPVAFVIPQSVLPKSTHQFSVRYVSSVVNVGPIPLRAKLQALLVLLHDQFGDQEAALEAKVRALLALPDSVLTGLAAHRDLADIGNILQDALLGTSDLSKVRTQLDKIEVASVAGPTENLDVVKVSGAPVFIVHTPSARTREGQVAGLPAPTPATTAGQVEMAEMPVVEVVPNPAMRAFAAPTTGEFETASFSVAAAPELAPPPALDPPPPAQAPPPPAPEPQSQVMSFSVAPSNEQSASPQSVVSLPSEAPSTAASAPAFTASTGTTSAEPTSVVHTSNDVMSSGNKFEPGEPASNSTGGTSVSAQSTSTSTNSPTSTSTSAHEEPTTGTSTTGTSTTGQGSGTTGGATGGQGSNESGGGGTSSSSNDAGGSGGGNSGESKSTG